MPIMSLKTMKDLPPEPVTILRKTSNTAVFYENIWQHPKMCLSGEPRPFYHLKFQVKLVKPRLHEIGPKWEWIHLDPVPFLRGVYPGSDQKRIFNRKRERTGLAVENCNRFHIRRYSTQFWYAKFHNSPENSGWFYAVALYCLILTSDWFELEAADTKKSN